MPAVNGPMFDNLDSETGSRDITLQRVLKFVVKGLVHCVQVADLVLQAEQDQSTIEPGQVWDHLTDGLNLVATGCHEINIRRRDMLKPKMQDKFRSLCLAKKPVDPKFLFGDDLAKAV